MNISQKTDQKRQVIDLTDKIAGQLSGTGIVQLFLRHTTAALTTADLDPGTDQDILKAIEQLTPTGPWQHPHDPNHFPDHLWSSLIGPSLTVPFESGNLMLGQWQRIVLLEFDGPRDRQIELTVIIN